MHLVSTRLKNISIAPTDAAAKKALEAKIAERTPLDADAGNDDGADPFAQDHDGAEGLSDQEGLDLVADQDVEDHKMESHNDAVM